MTTLLLDNFTGAASLLTGHTSDSGATWSAFDTDTTESLELTGAGALALLDAGAYNIASSGISPTGDYSVAAYATASLTTSGLSGFIIQALNNNTDYFGWYVEIGASTTDVYAWLYVTDESFAGVDAGITGLTPGAEHKIQVNVSASRTHYALYVNDALVAELDTLGAVPVSPVAVGGYCPVGEPAIVLNSIEVGDLTAPTPSAQLSVPSPLGAAEVTARHPIAPTLEDNFNGTAGSVLGRTPDSGGSAWAPAYGWGPSTDIDLDGAGNLYDAGATGDAVTAGGVFTEHDAHIILRSTPPVTPINLWGFGVFVGKHPDTAGEMIGFNVTYTTSSYKWSLSSLGTSAGPTIFSPLAGVEHEFVLQSKADGLTLWMNGTVLGTLPAYGGHDTSMVGSDVSVTLQQSGAIGYVGAYDGPYFPLPPKAMMAAPSMLGSTALLGFMPSAVMMSAPSVLGACGVLAYHDFTGLLGDAVTRYVMDLITPSGTVRVPISSWQATLQSGSSSYVQCVVPACLAWVDAINTATEFVIYRRADVPGTTLIIEYEMARSAVEQAQFNQGPQRYTCTLSGYPDAFAEDLDPPVVYDRTLAGVRSVSSGSGLRVRCAVDWLLRPGHRAYVGAVPFVVRYINYYALDGDGYMDVGE